MASSNDHDAENFDRLANAFGEPDDSLVCRRIRGGMCTRELLYLYWPSVCAIACELIKHRYLLGAEAEAIFASAMSKVSP
jgi:hypothetical protein